MLLFLGGFALWSAVRSEQAARSLKQTRSLTSAYEQARFAMDDERLLEHERSIGHGGNYLGAASVAWHDRFDRLADSFVAALGPIRRLGDASDRRLADALAVKQAAYHNAMDKVFVAARMGQSGMAQMDGMMADRGFTALSTRLTAATQRRSQQALRRLDSLSSTESKIRTATMIAIPIALLLFAGFAFVLRTYRRRAEQATQAELARLERAALEDNLTGVRNQRAFEEDLSRELARADRSGQPLALVMLDLNELKRVNDSLGHQAGDERLQLLAATMTEVARDGDSAYRVGGDEFALILVGTRAWGALRLAQRLQGALAARLDQPRVVTAGIAEAGPGIDRDALIRNADLALIEAKSSQRDALVYSRELRQTPVAPDAEDQAHHLKTLASALARAVDAKDSQTRSHCETVAETCALIGAQLGLDATRIAKLRLAGLLHDVGKIGVDDAILNNPGPLTDQEYEAMKTHSAIGHGIVCATELNDEADWILHHHERIDGHGYPDGLADQEIALESRIIFVADAFEAMTADRPYRNAMPEDQALAEMERNAGSQFDPRCVAALQRVLGKTPTSLTAPTP